MARKTASITITADNRDHNKTFYLTEMDAWSAHNWGERAAFALASAAAKQLGRDTAEEIASIDLDKDDAARRGFAIVAFAGIKALSGLDPALIGPLLMELVHKCVEVCPDPNRPEYHRPLMKDGSDIEEWTTIKKLQAEVFHLHTGFSLLGALSAISTSLRARKSTDSEDTPTSPTPLAPSSPPVS